NLQKKKPGFSPVNIQQVNTSHEIEKFDFTVNLWESDEGLHFNFSYSLDLFGHDTMMRYVRYFENIIHEAIADPEKKLSAFEILGPLERKILAGFNPETEQDSSKDPVLSMIELQTKTAPEA